MSFEAKWISIAAGLLFAGLMFVSEPASAESSRLGGEVIVKFAADHAINGEISTLLAHGNPTSKRIKTFVTELGNTLGVALRFQRITSGREVVVDIPRESARKQLAAHLAATTDVLKAEILRDREKTPPFELHDELVVSFQPATPQYQAIAQAAQRNSTPDHSVQALVSGLTEETQYRLLGRVLPDKRLVLRLDLAQTVSQLVKQMNELGEVDYAQPNFAVKAYP